MSQRVGASQLAEKQTDRLLKLAERKGIKTGDRIDVLFINSPSQLLDVQNLSEGPIENQNWMSGFTFSEIRNGMFRYTHPRYDGETGTRVDRVLDIRKSREKITG